MKTVINLFGTEIECKVVETKYHNGNKAVMLDSVDGGPVATISVNLPESSVLPKGMFYTKDWSENAQIVAQMVEQGLLIPAPELSPVNVGFVTAKVFSLKKD